MSEYLIVLLNSFSCCGTALCTNSVECPIYQNVVKGQNITFVIVGNVGLVV